MLNEDGQRSVGAESQRDHIEESFAVRAPGTEVYRGDVGGCGGGRDPASHNSNLFAMLKMRLGRIFQREDWKDVIE
jgi:hypothetical protein